MTPRPTQPSRWPWFAARSWLAGYRHLRPRTVTAHRQRKCRLMKVCSNVALRNPAGMQRRCITNISTPGTFAASRFAESCHPQSPQPVTARLHDTSVAQRPTVQARSFQRGSGRIQLSHHGKSQIFCNTDPLPGRVFEEGPLNAQGGGCVLVRTVEAEGGIDQHVPSAGFGYVG